MKIHCITVALFCLSATVVAAAQDTEKPVKMGNLPAAVQTTVREQSKGATLRGLSQETKDGQIFYEAELRFKGHGKDVLIDAAGKVVEIEEQVAFNTLPAPVQTAFKKQAGKGRILLVESITKDNALTAYEAHVKTGGKLSEIKVAPDGAPVNN